MSEQEHEGERESKGPDIVRRSERRGDSSGPPLSDAVRGYVDRIAKILTDIESRRGFAEVTITVKEGDPRKLEIKETLIRDYEVDRYLKRPV